MIRNKKTIISLAFTIILSLQVFSKEKHPFRTTEIGDSIYLDETEIDIGSWLSYYTWILEHDGIQAAEKVLPDSTLVLPEVWEYIRTPSTKKMNLLGNYTYQPIGYFEKGCMGNSRKCPLINYPVTGVSYEQVIAFCKWRTKVNGRGKLVYRLPTPKEWTDIVYQDLLETEKTKGLQDTIVPEKWCPTFNYFTTCDCEISDEVGILNISGYWAPRRLHAFDLFGNVAEMTSEKGIAKGGSYINYAKQCHPDSVQHYTKPEAWLGFRCIAVPYNEGVSNTDSNTIKVQGPLREIENSKLFVDSRDAKVYPTVDIGNQTWLASNLAYEPDSGKYWVYKHRKKKVDRLGYLYSWEVAKDVCPTGWHLPSKSEYEILLQEFASPYVAYKELLFSGNSGFSMINVGIHAHGEFIEYYNNSSKFWTSTEASEKKGNSFLINGSKSEVIINNNDVKKWGLSVRCIKDDE